MDIPRKFRDLMSDTSLSDMRWLTFDEAEALKPAAPLVHDPRPEQQPMFSKMIQDLPAGSNLCSHFKLRSGDVEQGFREADFVFEDVFRSPAAQHVPLEPHVTVAQFFQGKLTILTSTQMSHAIRSQMAELFNLPLARVRVIVETLGGGFGSKGSLRLEPITSFLALKANRPVKIILKREEEFVTVCKHPATIRIKTGVKKDGAITAMHFHSFLDGGAYGSYGVASTFYTGALQTVTYNVPRYKFQGLRAFTNKPPCGPKRGHGTPQSRFGQEVQLDKVAERLRIDPADLRLGMIAPAHSLTANYLRVGTIGLAECIRRVVDRSGWREKHGKSPYGRGFGLACSSYLSGAGLPIYWNDMPHSGVQLKLDRSGGVTAFCGATEIGQGSIPDN